MRWLLVFALAAACLWWLGQARTLSPGDIPRHSADPANGEQLFHAGSCAACHGSVSAGSKAKPDPTHLGGGLELNTSAGVFRVPNISPHPGDGIGAWSGLDFLNAMQKGVSPAGKHYFPSFPYTSYARMTRTDLLDLKAYLDGLPAVSGRVADHELQFPWSQRWLLGYWKRLFLSDSPVIDVPAGDRLLQRGRYLVEGPGHCGECHTPRNALQALQTSDWLSGAPNPDGEGRVPDITSSPGGLGNWSISDLRYYLETGVDPDFDVVGSSMVSVQENLARLSDEDRAAIAAYLKAVPVVVSPSPDKP